MQSMIYVAQLSSDLISVANSVSCDLPVENLNLET